MAPHIKRIPLSDIKLDFQPSEVLDEEKVLRQEDVEHRE
jgi:hypothetical protein